MIRLIPGAQAASFAQEIDAMFRCRAQTFHERLGWEVVVRNGYERDEFDDQNPLYVVSVDPETGQYLGSLRLLPTTGPNMLRDVFPYLLDDGQVVESALIWEASRICALPHDAQPERARGQASVFAELLVGIGDVALRAGLTQIVAVFDARIFRMLKAAGCNPQIIGKPRRIGDTMSYAGLFDMGEAFQRAVRNGLGIEGSVLERETEVSVFETNLVVSSGRKTRRVFAPRARLETHVDRAKRRVMAA
jgi:acyl homoserine lactone synthase